MKKVYCKKKFNLAKNSYFEKDSYYDVVSFDDGYYWISLGNGMVQLFYIIDKKPKFEDYFYTIKQVRKIKLSKLNE